MQPVAALQLAQARRVRRRDVDRDVVGQRVERAQAGDIVGDRIGAVAIGADIDAERPGQRAQPLEPGAHRLETVVVEAHPVDQGLLAGRRNRRGFGLPACGRGVTVPTSTKLKPRPKRPGDGLGVLVEARGEAERVGEIEPQEPGPEPGRSGKTTRGPRPDASARIANRCAVSGGRSWRPRSSRDPYRSSKGGLIQLKIEFCFTAIPLHARTAPMGADGGTEPGR